MKHIVKVISAQDNILTLKVDGVLCAYFIQRPQPLGLQDATTLKAAMDTGILESLFRASGYVSPQERLYQKFCRLLGSWRHRDRVPLFGETVAEFIKKVGVEVNIDKKTKGVVMLKSDIDKIRTGAISL